MQLWGLSLLLWLSAGWFATVLAHLDPNIKSIPVCLGISGLEDLANGVFSVIAPDA